MRNRDRATGVGLEKLREDDETRQTAGGRAVIGCCETPPLHTQSILDVPSSIHIVWRYKLEDNNYRLPVP